MSAEWTDLMQTYRHELVGGQLILFIDGKRVVAGTKAGPSFNYTPEGVRLVEELDTKPVEKRAPGRPRKEE